MKSTSNPIDRWSVYFAAGFISFCAIMVSSVMPLVVTALHRTYGFREGQLGDIVGCYFGGVTLVSLTTFAWIRRFDWRVTATVGQVISAIAFFSCMVRHSYTGLEILMAIAGIGGGITNALAFTLCGDSDNTDKAFGINVFFQSALSTVMIVTLPVIFANDASDTRRLAAVMGGTVVLTTTAVLWLPRAGRKSEGGGQAAGNPIDASGFWLPLLGTLVTFLFQTAWMAPWVFIEEAGTGKGLDSVFVGVALGVAMFVSVFGSVIPPLIGDRYGRFYPLCIASAEMIVGMYMLDIFHGRAVFALAASIFILPINFLITYSLGLTAEADTKGRFIGLSTASVSASALVTPVIAGRMYEKYGYQSSLWIGALSLILGLTLYGTMLQVARGRGLVRSYVKVGEAVASSAS